ncbi:vault protein inter-alpha-trypsin domain-containing protein, partial [Kalaharituber pfeilii]
MAYKGPSREVVNQGIYCHEHWSPIGYPLLSTIYYYNVHQTFVSALLTETYEAQTNIAREVSYLFQVPPEASVCRFSATLGNTKVEAIIEEKSRAKTIYTDAVKANQKAWLLEQVNTEVFQISLGKVQPNDKIIIKITYVHHISSDSLQDSLRLTIPSGYTNRPGAAPAQETTAPTASKSGPAVTIRVSIDQGDQHILGLTCLSNHYPSIMPGFADDSYRRLSPVEQSRMYNRGLAYVELMSDTFLSTHFILTWNVPYIDQPRCLVEKAGDTLAFALTFVSNVRLAAAAH